MLLLGLCLCLGIAHAIIPETSKTDMDIIANMETNILQGPTTQTHMFKEVEELMEDTQHKLEDAVNQMDNETAKSGLHPHNVSSNLQDESSMEITTGNQSTYIADRNNMTADNATNETVSRTTQSSDKVSSIDHECFIDEDCEKGKFCLYETRSSKCLPCKQTDATCSRDEECCVGQLCVWGQCAHNGTRGDAGTICENQTDCKEDLCCAFHKALLFPVCSSKPIERERCIISANHPLELVSGDMQRKGPQEHCPCAGDLQCQRLGRGALCLESQNTGKEELTDKFLSASENQSD